MSVHRSMWKCIGVFSIPAGVALFLGVLPLAGCSSSSKTGNSAAPAGDSGGGGDATTMTSNPGSPDAGIVATGDDTNQDIASDDESDAGGDALVDAGPHATMRVADFAAPLSYGVLQFDFCLSTDPPSASTSWFGPMLRGTDTWITTNEQTPYFDVPVGTRSLRLVPLNSPDCLSPYEGIPDLAFPTPLAEGGRSTVVLIGAVLDAGPVPIEIKQFTDIVEDANGPNDVRFLNVAEAAGAIDIYAYSGYGGKDPCILLFDNVPLGAAGQAATPFPGDGGPTAANGYTPLRGVTLYDLGFQSYTLSFASHGQDCHHGFAGLYSTDGPIGAGAWTFFISDTANLLCRDDGTPNPRCDRQ